MIDIAPNAIQVVALWGGVLILWLLVLSGVTVRRRRRHLVAFGDGGNAELTAASRAFGNAAEYVPAGMIALVLLALIGAPVLLLHGVGGVLLAGRVIHALGLLFQKGPSLGRVSGMILTYVALLVAAVSLIAYGVI